MSLDAGLRLYARTVEKSWEQPLGMMAAVHEHRVGGASQAFRQLEQYRNSDRERLQSLVDALVARCHKFLSWLVIILPFSSISFFSLADIERVVQGSQYAT